MDPNETLRALREQLADAHMFREADSNDAELEALWGALDCAELLDEWLTRGGFLPRDWERA